MNNEINIAAIQVLTRKGESTDATRRQNTSPGRESMAPKNVRQLDVLRKNESTNPLQMQNSEAKKEQSEPLENVVSDINSLVQDLQRELQFTVDEESGESVVKVMDRKTDEVIRQIPAEEILELRKRLEETRGVIFKGSA